MFDIFVYNFQFHRLGPGFRWIGEKRGTWWPRRRGSAPPRPWRPCAPFSTLMHLEVLGLNLVFVSTSMHIQTSPRIGEKRGRGRRWRSPGSRWPRRHQTPTWTDGLPQVLFSPAIWGEVGEMMNTRWVMHLDNAWAREVILQICAHLEYKWRFIVKLGNKSTIMENYHDDWQGVYTNQTRRPANQIRRTHKQCRFQNQTLGPIVSIENHHIQKRFPLRSLE